MEQTEVDFKELPYYKAIFKSFLTRQIQHLLEELSDETGEESIILTANINNGTLSQLGSNTGKGFLQGRDDIKTQFLDYCLKTNQPSPGKGAKQFQKRLNKSSGKAPASKRPRVDVPSGSSASQSTLPFPKLQKFVNNSPAQTKTPGQPSPPPLQPCPVSLYPALSQPFTVTSADGSQATNDITVIDLQNTGCDETDIKKESVEYAAMKAIGNELQLLQSYTDKSSDSNTFYSNQNVSTKDSYNEPNTDSEQNEENVQKSQNSNDPQEMNFGCMEIKTEPQDSGDETYAGSDNLSYMNDSQGLVGEDNSTSATESGTAPTSHYKYRPVKKQPKERVELSLADKLNILNDYETSKPISQRDLAKKYNVGKTCIYDILRKKDYYLAIQSQNLQDNSVNLSKKRINVFSKYGDVNRQLFEWYKTEISTRERVSGPELQHIALQIASDLGQSDFKASNGWLNRWQARYNINTPSSKQNLSEFSASSFVDSIVNEDKTSD